MLGMSTVWHPEQRAGGDYYTTDPKAVYALFNKMQLPQGSTIWEPACGCGNISNALTDLGFNVISTDLFSRGFGIPGVNFLETTKVPDGCRAIITNPPYSLSDEFILHAMDILPDGGIYAALLNINYLAGKARFRSIYDKNLLHGVYVFSSRVNCYKNNHDEGHSSPVNYGWYIFKKGNDSPPFIQWI